MIFETGDSTITVALKSLMAFIAAAVRWSLQLDD
jgi:hypothetical protein